MKSCCGTERPLSLRALPLMRQREYITMPAPCFCWISLLKTLATTKLGKKTERKKENDSILFWLMGTNQICCFSPRQRTPSGECFNYHVNFNVSPASYKYNESNVYGIIESADQNVELECPDPVTDTCNTQKGVLTWYRVGLLLTYSVKNIKISQKRTLAFHHHNCLLKCVNPTFPFIAELQSSTRSARSLIMGE